MRATAAGLGIPTTARHPVGAAAAGHAPPQRIAIPEPPRRTPPPMRPVTAIHAGIIYGVHPAHGLPGHPPPLLRPSEIDRMLSAARRRASLPLAQRPLAAQSVLVRPVTSGGTRGRAAPGKPGARATHSIQSSSGTGINPWWRYQEETIPGVGRAMINVGTGNLLLQADDMSVPHKGISLAFRRTYNSQSQHDVAGTDGGPPTMSGNGWTNTFDAHITGSKTGTMTVWDIDGARYDYTLAADGITRIPPPGQHAILVYDGYCGYYWTKKSGTTYVFWGPDVPSCPTWWYPTFGAYAGRTYQIIGRNRNTNITFSYSWDNGNSAPGGKISTITAQTESGLTATLSFADVSGHRLLQQLVFPDGVTSVNYYYYANGDLGDVVSPTNNAAGTRPDHSFGYTPFGTGTILLWASSPRWCASTCGTDGAWTRFDFTGNDHPSSTLIDIGFGGVVNPSIPDGSNQTVLQPGYPTGAVGYLSEFFTTGVSTPAFRDSDGHATNWVVDAAGRPTQTQECTATAGGTCTGTWLVSNETWDSDNNLATEVDARGNETDYLYDLRGNTTAVGEPYTTTSQGSFKPTRLFDYDAFNNVTAYCDQSETHAMNGDWTPSTTSIWDHDDLCAAHTNVVPHWGATYSYPSQEPYGELASMTTPMGYTRQLAYAPAQQAGNDFGLPTSITGTAFTQYDGSTITPTETIWYDASGNLRCYGKGSGASVLSYDALGRMTSMTDPDDTSANPGSLCGKSTGQPGWNTQTVYSYFPDGSRATVQTPAQRAANASTAYSYDLDGNVTTEIHNYGWNAQQAPPPANTRKWYDGADRLVEVALPKDANDSYYPDPWRTRYLYDLSQGQNVNFLGASFLAHGNLYRTQEWVVPPGASSSTWLDIKGAAFDALDREAASYRIRPGSNGTLTASQSSYDVSTNSLGLLTSKTDEIGETAQYGYDELGRETTRSYSNDGGVTPRKVTTYDANGRVVAIGNSTFGNKVYNYDGDGRLTEVDEPSNSTLTSPARIGYDYYPNGQRKDVTVASALLNQNPLLSYSYRLDGLASSISLRYAAATYGFASTFTDGGRPLSRTDPFTGMSVPNPSPPIAAGSVYRPTTWTYGIGDGQLTSLQLPFGANYTSITHDHEGQLASWHNNSSAGDVLTTVATSVRGENLGTTTSAANGGVASTIIRLANGAVVPDFLGGGVDPYNAVPVGAPPTQAFGDPDGSGFQVPCPTPDSLTVNYDAARRLLMRETVKNDAQCVIKDGPRSDGVWSYDAENRTLTGPNDSTQNAWGPDGLLYAHGVISAHYDGATVLFTTYNGALANIKVPGLGYLNFFGNGVGFTVTDRDMSDHLVSKHSAAGYDGLGLVPGSWRTRCGQGFAFESGGGGPTGCTTSAVLGATVYPSAYQSSSPGTQSIEVLPYVQLDGFDLFGTTIQGVRATDQAAGTWTTPDAYQGDVHDPMSQKPFMWNRNNPYQYSDPSGYDPGEMPIGGGETVPIDMKSPGSELEGLSALEKGGRAAPKWFNDHHIVPQRMWRAQPARDVLKRLQIWIHSDANLTPLTIWGHRSGGVHTKAAIEWVNGLVTTAETNGKEAVEKVLREIGDRIQRGVFPGAKH